MSVQPILSVEQRDEMAALRRRGWSAPRIARWFAARGTHVSDSTIEYQCLAVGADLPPARRQPARPDPRPYRRHGNLLVRPFTPGEDAALRALAAEGLTCTEIGRRLGRAHNSVKARLLILARHQSRREEPTNV